MGLAAGRRAAATASRPSPRRAAALPRRARRALFALAAALLSSCSSAGKPEAPPARGGVLDLRDWDFDSGNAALAGEWGFAAGRFVQPARAAEDEGFVPRRVPDRWKGGDAGGVEGRGGGSYRLLVLLPPERDDLALRYTTVSTAFEIYANGFRISSGGRPSLDPREARAAYRPAVVPLPPTQSGRLELLVHVSNHEYREGGMWRAFSLGPARSLSVAKKFRDAYSIGLAAGLAAMSVHALILFLHRRRERSYLYFSLFSALIALRTLVTGEYVFVELFPAVSFDALIRLEYASAFLALPAAIALFIFLFQAEAGTFTRVALLVPTLPFILELPVAPLPFLTRSIYLFYPTSWVLMLATLVVIVIRAAVRRKPGGLVLLVAGFVVGAAAVNDMLYSSFSFPSSDLIPFGLAVFILAQDFVLSRRFTAAFDEAERLYAELGRANGLLQREVLAHEEARAKLELLLAEKETHLKEIHHRVKNSLQIVSSIAALQAHRLDNPEAEEALATLRERIRSISLVHEKLYGSASSELLDIGEYAEELVRRLAAGFGSGEGLRLELDIEHFPLAMDLCVDLGLVIAELAANAFKHGLGRGRAGGRLELELRREGEELFLSVADDGPGYPEGFKAEESPSLGFKIVTSLLKKRGGSLSLSSSGGARAELRIPLPRDGEGGGASRKP